MCGSFQMPPERALMTAAETPGAAAPPPHAPPEPAPAPAPVWLPGFLASRMHLVRFAAFAVAAILINLLTQNAVLVLLAGYWFTVYAALVVGTGTGLVFKYIADKNWVFEATSRDLVDDSRKFALYTATGILTTVIFWGVELSFHYIFQTHVMTVLGGVIGLVIGYVVKYNLDKRITFRSSVAP
jgi:putative flippase GtrA